MGNLHGLYCKVRSNGGNCEIPFIVGEKYKLFYIEKGIVKQCGTLKKDGTCENKVIERIMSQNNVILFDSVRAFKE